MEAGNWFHRRPLFCLMSDLDGILLGQRKRERKLRKEIKTERKVGGRKRNVSERVLSALPSSDFDLSVCWVGSS